MRTYLLIAASTALFTLQFGCSGDEKKSTSDTKPAAPAASPEGVSAMSAATGAQHLRTMILPPETTGSDDSPIIVGSGSFHVRQKDSIFAQAGDPYHFSVDAKDHEVRTISFGKCPQNLPVNPGTCRWDQTTPVNNNMPWTLQFNDGGTTSIGSLAFSDPHYPSFVLFSVYYKLTPEDDNGHPGDGEGYTTADVSLGGAVLTVNGAPMAQWTCAPAAGMSCTIRIRYCSHGLPDGSCRS